MRIISNLSTSQRRDTFLISTFLLTFKNLSVNVYIGKQIVSCLEHELWSPVTSVKPLFVIRQAPVSSSVK